MEEVHPDLADTLQPVRREYPLNGVPQGASWAARMPLLVLLAVVGGWLLLRGYNPSNGALLDFDHYHLVTVRQFIALPWPQFLHDMNTASGPLFYALAGLLHLSQPEWLRPAVLLVHLVSTAVLWSLAQRARLDTRASVLLCLAFFFSPFQLGPALWAHPETLAMLVMLSALALDQSALRSDRFLWLMPLAVAARQTSIAIVGAQMLEHLLQRRWRAVLVQGVLVLAVLVGLIQAWGGLTPPNFQHHVNPSLRTGLAAMGLLSLGLLGWTVRGPQRPGLAQMLQRLVVLAPLVTGLYGLSGPFDGGGFVFSRLDALDTQRLHLGWPVSSPLLIALMLAWCGGALRAHPLLAAQMVLCAVVLASSGVLYTKYVDYFFWPLLCMALHHGTPALRQALVRSACTWTALHLVMVSLTYQRG